MSTPDQPTRTFHTNDYRRTASLLQSFRHVRGDMSIAKAQASQAKVNALAALLASAFSQDAESAPGAPFSEFYFMEGTRLPDSPQPSAGVAGELAADLASGFASAQASQDETDDGYSSDPWAADGDTA